MERTTTAGETVAVKETWKGDLIVLVDEAGNEYAEAGSGKIEALTTGAMPKDPDEEAAGGQTETVEEPEPETTPEPEAETTEGADEDGAQGGATEEPIG